MAINLKSIKELGELEFKKQIKYMKYYDKKMEDMFKSNLIANEIYNYDHNYIPPKKSIYQKVKGYFSWKIYKIKDFIKYVMDYNKDY